MAQRVSARGRLILVRKTGQIAFITLNRPDKLNAINAEMRQQFRSELVRLDRDDSVSVLVLTGAGDRAFSSGTDLTEVPPKDAMTRRAATLEEASRTIGQCQKPVIAMIHGYAIGGGCELAVACDIRVAATNAILGFPEIRLGRLPAGGGGTQILPRLVGKGQAAILIMTGEFISAESALAIGLVDKVVPPDALLSATTELATQIARHDLGALILAKSALRVSQSTNLDVGVAYERELSVIRYLTDPGRTAGWKGRRDHFPTAGTNDKAQNEGPGEPASETK